LDPHADLAVPPGVVDYLPGLKHRLPFDTAVLDTWSSADHDGMRVTAVPARHVNGRWFVDELWSRRANTGWIVEYHGLTVYFAGDTAYDPKMFREIRRRFPHIDLALMPTGPSGTNTISRWFGRMWHVDEDQAMRAFLDVGAHFMIPIHHGTFYRSGIAEDRTIARAIARHGLLSRVMTLAIGQTITFTSATR
jgi:L-ascorbate metabolism protein UlaG (beta-lactamase superfamily)